MPVTGMMDIGIERPFPPIVYDDASWYEFGR